MYKFLVVMIALSAMVHLSGGEEAVAQVRDSRRSLQRLCPMDCLSKNLSPWLWESKRPKKEPNRETP